MNIDTYSRFSATNANAVERSPQNKIDGKHVDALVQMVRVGIHQIAKPNSRSESSVFKNDDAHLSDHISLGEIEKKEGSVIGRRSDDVDAGTNGKNYQGEIDTPEVNTGLVLPSSALPGGRQVVPAELDTLIQMLMMLFGSGAIRSDDKRKVMAFIRELTDLANHSGDPDLKEGLDFIFKNGLDRLRNDTDVSADDLAELERVISQLE